MAFIITVHRHRTFSFSSFRFYRAPEILLGLPFCEKVDMWSLGCVLAELFLGWPLYPGKSELEQVRYICETQGLPQAHFLNIATKTHLFFQITTDQHGAPAWELKPSVQGPNGEIVEHRKYIFSSLDELCNRTITKDNKTANSEDEAAGITDCHCMVELIKRMLTLVSHQRINPDAALRHSFITLVHLDSPDTQDHHHASLQELQKAVIQTSSTGHRAKNCNQKAEVIIHDTRHNLKDTAIKSMLHKTTSINIWTLTSNLMVYHTIGVEIK